MTSSAPPFYVKNCSLAVIATGDRASCLIELRDKLANVSEGCLYYHFWGSRMDPQHIAHRFHNDFACWAFHVLHDNLLAEQLAILDPTNLENLRHQLIESIELRLDEYPMVPWIPAEKSFHFIRSTMLVFDSKLSISDPRDLPKLISQLTSGSIFYHFIDSRLRTPEHIDDFSAWLKNFGDRYFDLIEKIQAIDPYFFTLTKLKEELLLVLNLHFKNGEAHD